MSTLTIPVATALTRIASHLVEPLTNSIIDRIARSYGGRADGSNKHDRLTCLLQNQWDVKGRDETGRVVAALMTEAYSRTIAGKSRMTRTVVESVIRDLRTIGIVVEDSERVAWLEGLPASVQTRDPPIGSIPSAARVVARRHDRALAHVADLTRDSRWTPQMRGLQLERVVMDVLNAEGLRPERDVRNPGEQLDIAFEMDGNNYLVECKWWTEPTPAREVEVFMSRVASKAEGTFGVVLSMSGFPRDINSAAATGRRLTAVGLGPSDLMCVLEGRTTWAQCVRDARRLASTKSEFCRRA